MGSLVLLVFADPVDPEGFIDVVENLGGDRRPAEFTDAHLGRDGAHIWVEADADKQPEIAIDDWFAHEEKLGAPPRGSVVLNLSGGPSDALAMEIIESAARRWRFIVDNADGGLFTVDELRAFPQDRIPFKGK